MMSRRGLHDALDKAFQKHFFEDEDDALDVAARRKKGLEMAAEGTFQLSPLNGDDLPPAAGSV